MATIKEEIMSIAEAQGYEGEGGSTIAEAVNALGSVMGGGGGGSATMIVTITGYGSTYAADKTIAEIIEHVDSGGDVIAVYDQSRGAKESMFVFRLQTYGRSYATFAMTPTSAQGATIYYLGITTDAVTLKTVDVA